MASSFDTNGQNSNPSTVIGASGSDAVLGGSVQGAQASGAAQPIGTVEALNGSVTATRADGTQVQLQAGDPVYQGDTLETGANGSVGVVLADQTTFSMADNGQMVLDEMVYDPGTQQGSISISAVEGVFTFVSGQVAKTDPDAMTLQTPVATIGIRGTQVGLDVSPAHGTNVVLMEEADGFVGEVVVSNDAGVQILNNAFQGTSIVDAATAPVQPVIIDMSAMLNTYGSALQSLPESDNSNRYDQSTDGANGAQAGEHDAAANQADGHQADGQQTDGQQADDGTAPGAAGLADEAGTDG